MKTIAVRHHLKERAKQKRRISFSIHPRNPMSKDWTEAQLEEQLKEYVERKALLKRLEQEHKSQGELIRLHYEAHNLQSCGLGEAHVNVVSRPKITYSDTYRRDKAKTSEEFKKREQVEIENFHNPKYDGPLQCKSYDPNPFHHLEVRFGEGE